MTTARPAQCQCSGEASLEDPTAHEGLSPRIRVGDARLTARLDDNAPANDLAAQLPLTLTFRDHNSVEKTAPLSRELSLEGVPRRPRSGRRRHRLLGPRWSAGSLLRRRSPV